MKVQLLRESPAYLPPLDLAWTLSMERVMSMERVTNLFTAHFLICPSKWCTYSGINCAVAAHVQCTPYNLAPDCSVIRAKPHT